VTPRAAPTPAGLPGQAPARKLHPGLLLALVAAAALSLWSLAMPEDDEPQALARPGAAGPGVRDGASGGWGPGSGSARTPLAAAAGARAFGAAAAPPVTAAALQAQAERWSQRADWPPLSEPARLAWGPPPPPPPPAAEREAAPPPPPTAPPFPYQLVGRWQEEAAPANNESAAAPHADRAGAADRAEAPPAAGRVKAVVAGPQATWVLGPGEVIDGQWRIDQIGPRSLQLTYLPLQLPQTVAMKTP
jgi:hypothetical protein